MIKFIAWKCQWPIFDRRTSLSCYLLFFWEVLNSKSSLSKVTELDKDFNFWFEWVIKWYKSNDQTIETNYHWNVTDDAFWVQTRHHAMYSIKRTLERGRETLRKHVWNRREKFTFYKRTTQHIIIMWLNINAKTLFWRWPYCALNCPLKPTSRNGYEWPEIKFQFSKFSVSECWIALNCIY